MQDCENPRGWTVHSGIVTEFCLTFWRKILLLTHQTVNFDSLRQSRACYPTAHACVWIMPRVLSGPEWSARYQIRWRPCRRRRRRSSPVTFATVTRWQSAGHRTLWPLSLRDLIAGAIRFTNTPWTVSGSTVEELTQSDQDKQEVRRRRRSLADDDRAALASCWVASMCAWSIGLPRRVFVNVTRTPSASEWV